MSRLESGVALTTATPSGLGELDIELEAAGTIERSPEAERELARAMLGVLRVQAAEGRGD